MDKNWLGGLVLVTVAKKKPPTHHARHSPLTCQECFPRRIGTVLTLNSPHVADTRAVIPSEPPPPVHTKLYCLAIRMATQRDDVEYNKMFLNACVLLDGL